MNAIDFSYSRLTTDAIRKFEQDGVVLFIQCLWTGAEMPPACIPNLKLLRQERKLTAGYISLTAREPGAQHVSRPKSLIPNELWQWLAGIAIDVELPDILDYNIWDALVRVQNSGKTAFLYTSKNAWTNYVRHVRGYDFSSWPLWDAHWGVPPNLDVDYGPWTRAVGHQYNNDVSRYGVTVDENYFDPAWIAILRKEAGLMFNDWGNKKIVGFDGRPVKFRVLRGDLSVEERELTYREFVFLDALGLVDRPAHRDLTRRLLEQANALSTLQKATQGLSQALDAHVQTHNQNAQIVEKEAVRRLAAIRDDLKKLDKDIERIAEEIALLSGQL